MLPMSSLLVGIREMMDGFEPSAIISAGKELYGALVKKVKSLSPFLDDISNQTFLVAFIVTFIATKAIDIVASGAFSAAKATLKTTESALGAFSSKVKDEVIDLKNGMKNVVTNPYIRVLKDTALMPLSITKNIIFSIDSLISAPLVRKVISETNYKGIFRNWRCISIDWKEIRHTWFSPNGQSIYRY